MDPADPGRVVVTASNGPREAHNPAGASSGIFHKESGGPWREATQGLPAREGRVAAILAANEAEPGIFYALTNGGLYRSPNGGSSWECLEVAWPDRYLRRRPGALAVFEAG